MPRLAIDYSKTVIYKIVCNDPNIKELYVGSTTDFTRRKWQHKSNCDNINNIAFNRKLYTAIRNNGGFENWNMVEIEKFPCNDGNEARARERHIYEQQNASLNIIRPYITDAEHVEYKKQYNEANKESNKQYRDNNKQSIIEYRKHYYETKKQDILEKLRQPYTCQCGATCRIVAKARHCRTKKHIQFIEQNNI
jgi:hypothetical protein